MVREIKRVVNENRFASVFLAMLLAAVLSWGTWVTVQIFYNISDNKETKASVYVLKSGLEEVKVEIKESNRETMANQTKIIELLNDIKKNDKQRKQW